MQTKNLIQSQANVIKITKLRKGDVIKLLEKEYNTFETFYGVVLDLYNTGESSFIEILKYKKAYEEVRGEIKIYEGDCDLNIFPATTDDVYLYFSDAIEGIERVLKKEKEEIVKKEEALIKAKEFTSGEKAKKLTDTSFEEITQERYNEKKKEEAIERIHQSKTSNN